MAKQKLYCYVDESGQDTKGKIFLVSVVITGKERDTLREKLKEIEKLSCKRKKKWSKAKRKQKESYVERIIDSKIFVGHIYYSYYQDTKAYFDLTVFTTAKAVHDHDKVDNNYEAIIFVDGLRRSERFRFGSGLRKLKVTVKKVRGIRDEADEFIRLADAMAGLARNSLLGDRVMQSLLERVESKRIIKKV